MRGAVGVLLGDMYPLVIGGLSLPPPPPSSCSYADEVEYQSTTDKSLSNLLVFLMLENMSIF